MSKEYHALWEPIYGAIILIGIYSLSMLVMDFFTIFTSMPKMVILIPLFIFGFLIVSCIFVSVLKLKCVKHSEKKIAIADNKLIDNMLEFNERIQITPVEKKLVKYTISIPFYFFALTVIVTLLLVFLNF